MIVQRAGDVIPQVVGPVLPHAKGSRRFRMPKNCPLCGTEIVRPEGEAMHRCPNPKCESRGLETLINWVWDIDGVGEQAIRRLWREGIVTSLPDLYRLTKEQLMSSTTRGSRESEERSPSSPCSLAHLPISTGSRVMRAAG